MKAIKVSVYLSEDFRATCTGYVPTAPYREALKLVVYADTDREACEVAFMVCNSAVEELHCDRAYTDDVRRYRTAGNRSLSVGDVVEADGTLYAVEDVGWYEVHELPPVMIPLGGAK